MSKKIKKGVATLLTATFLGGIFVPVIGQAQIGRNPALEEVDDTSRIQEIYDNILNSVHEQLMQYFSVIDDVYVDTDIHEHLSTDYRDIEYPSEVQSEEGFVNSELAMNSVKQPITEPSLIELADYIRYYQFHFTDRRSFATLSENSRARVSEVEDLDDSRKLNYFDYIVLIDSIDANPNYSQTVKEQKLGVVEDDIQNSIDLLYGYDAAGRLSGWEDAKSVSAPFNRGKYTYLQLVAAYRKDDNIIDTLEYFSALLDTLYAIQRYSIDTRLQRDPEFNQGYYAENIIRTYADVEKSVIRPAAEVIREQNRESQALEDGEIWQMDELTRQGLTNDGR